MITTISLSLALGLMGSAYLIERWLRRKAQAHNRELRDRLTRQADVISQKDAVNESLRAALIRRGGLVNDTWPEIIQ